MQEQQNSSIGSISVAVDPSPAVTSKLTLEQRALLEAKLLRKVTPQTTVSAASPDLAAGHTGSMPLSFAQESLWFLDQYAPNSSLYNIPHVLKLTGSVDCERLARAVETVVRRHDSLRTRFVSVNGKPAQELESFSAFQLPVNDFSKLAPQERHSEAQRLIAQESVKPFDLSTGPLIRGSILRLDRDQHIVMFTMHHIVSDLWSFQVFYREVSAAYRAISRGEEPSLPRLRLQFPEHAACQRRKMEGSAYTGQLAYWKEQLGGEIPVLELPIDHPRGAEVSFKGRRKRMSYSGDILRGIKEVSRAFNTTSFVTLMAAFQTLLHRYSNQEDIIVGSPMSSRNNVDAEQMIGLLINTLPIRTRFDRDLSFKDVVERVKQSVFGALTHHEAPIERLIDDLKIPRSGARNPLFQTVFQFVPDSAPALCLDGVAVEALPIELGTSKFDWTVTLGESADGLTGDIEYSTELFDDSTIDRFVAHFGTLLESVIPAPNEKIGRLNILPGAERKLVVQDWALAPAEYPSAAALPELFEQQVARNPEAIAVVFENQRLSYLELNRRSNQLARHLQRLGVRPDTMVGFCVERSLEMVIGVLAILKAGGAYVTLDPTLPRERLAYMFEDTRSPVFVTTQNFRSLAPAGSDVVCVDEPEMFEREEETNLEVQLTGDNLAYVIYTSGSTGKPKGVLVPHRGVVRLVKNANYLEFSSQDVFLQFANISFDASTLELWGPLLNGGKLVVFPSAFESLEQLGAVIRQHGVTTLWLTAGLFHEMVEHHVCDLQGVRFLLAGGDVLSPAHVSKALHELPNTRIINGYGPTENTTFTCCYPIPKEWQSSRSVPIGRPISNTEVFVLDDLQRPVPVGIPGELYVGGDGLAREYLNSPELTREKFVSTSTVSGGTKRLYRTGDRVRWLADGNLEFLGRLDNQVKIRGFRIELSEVETALSQHPSVQQCAVIAREDSSKTRQLIGYVVLRNDAISTGELREFLASRLPAYMVPSGFVKVEQLPLNTSGKVDRRRLPEMKSAIEQNSSAAPTTKDPTQAKIANIWEEVLGIQAPGLHENFFELGGHSLLATRVMSRVNGAFNRNLPLRALFEAPTVAGLALKVAEEVAPATNNGPILRRARRPSAGKLNSASGGNQ